MNLRQYCSDVYWFSRGIGNSINKLTNPVAGAQAGIQTGMYLASVYRCRGGEALFRTVVYPFTNEGMGDTLFGWARNDNVYEAGQGCGDALIMVAAAGVGVAELSTPGGAPGSRVGKDFTVAGKREVLRKAVTAEGDILCAECGVKCVRPEKSMSGVTPNANEWQIDHVFAKSRGGSGTPDNGQVLCRQCNRNKWDSLIE